MIGQTISHYKILEKLGEGGMGIVYKAEDLKLKRLVAIKFLPKRLSVHGEERERFTLEAQAASSLNHPNICVIHEIDEVNGETFMVMEYVDGMTLREWIQKKSEQADGYRKLGMKEIVDIASQIAEGLEKAHEKGIVHRDIKSENIMVTDDSRAKIMDFGLAKLRGVSKLTKTGSTIGTIAYMSPEQVEGTETDHRTDIFSFGVLLYEMLTGQLPFRAAHETAMMYEIINVEPKSVSELRQSVDDELNRIVMKCLEKNRDERYQSMRDVSVDLRRYRRDSTGKKIDRPVVPHEHAPAKQQASSSSVPWIKIGLIAGSVVLLASIAWYLLTMKSSSLDSLAVLPFANATTDPNTEYLSEGITENIINKLSQLSKLRVIPRSMIGKYKGKDTDPREVGKDLNVSAVLTGKVTQRGDELIIQAELIDVEHVSQLWGEQYNRKLSDLLTVQQDIAVKVTEKLQTQITGDERKNLGAQHTTNAEAYQLYLKGRYYWNKRTDEGVLRGMQLFKDAIEVDPNFALAYSGIADAYVAYSATSLKPKEYMPLLKAAAEKALELNDQLAEAHASLGVYKGYFEWDLTGAEQEWRKAISLNPNYATAHHWLAEFLLWQGRSEEGFAEYELATKFDPISLAIATDVGAGYYFSRQYDRSIAQLKKCMEMDPNYVRTHFYIMGPYLMKGLPDSAFYSLINGMKARGDSAEAIKAVTHAYRQAGFKGIGKLEIERGRGFGDAQTLFNAARSYLDVGDKEQALKFLEWSYNERQYFIMTLKADPIWDPLRTEPRFIALLKKVGLEK